MGSGFSSCLQICSSCCGNRDTSSQFGGSTESLLEELPYPTARKVTVVQRKYDCSMYSSEEQSEINQILQEMASNVIDVSSLNSYGLDPHVYRERMKYYANCMRPPAFSKVIKRPPPDCILTDLPNPENILSAPPLIPDDRIQSCSLVLDEIDEMFGDMKIDLPEKITVPFYVNS